MSPMMEPEQAWPQEAPLPTSIRVGFQTFAVEEIAEPEAGRGSYKGVSSFSGAYIAVTRKGNAIDVANTLLHEVLHMCWSTMDIQDGDREEHTITTLTNALCQVWRDSPELIAFLDAALGLDK